MRFKQAGPQNHDDANAPVLAVLDRLWQTKIQSISLIESWRKESKDADLRSGLGAQLEDERRHLRLAGEEIKRLGGRVTTERREGTVGRAFSAVRAQSTDLLRLCAYYRGIKLATHSRTSQFIQVVETRTGSLLDMIARDEERHIRWADIRMAHQMTAADMRECNLLMDKMSGIVEAAWQKLWLDLVRTRSRLSS